MYIYMLNILYMYMADEFFLPENSKNRIIESIFIFELIFWTFYGNFDVHFGENILTK